MDLKFLAGAFSPLVNSQHEASVATCKDLILEQAMAIATGKGEKPDPLAQRLSSWLDSAQVTCVTSLSPLAHHVDALARPCFASVGCLTGRQWFAGGLTG